MGHTRDLGVLLRHALVGVDHNETHVGALDGHGRPQNGKFLDLVIDLGLFPHAGRVDEEELADLIFKVTVHRVAGGAGHVGDDDPLLPQNAVDEGGLAHIGLADDGNFNDVALLFLFLLRGEVVKAGVQQVAGAVAVDGRDGDGVAQA